MPVPVTIWPSEPDERALAARLLTTFTRRRDLTVAVDPDPALIAAAASVGQRLLGLASHREADTLAALADQASLPTRRARLRIQPMAAEAIPAALATSPPTVGLIVAPTACSPDLLDAAVRVLCRDGILVLATPPGASTWSLSAAQLATARRAGLGYLQHIVAVDARIDNGRWQPTHTATHDQPAADRVHRRIHRDWYVFCPAGAR